MQQTGSWLRYIHHIHQVIFGNTPLGVGVALKLLKALLLSLLINVEEELYNQVAIIIQGALETLDADELLLVLLLIDLTMEIVGGNLTHPAAIEERKLSRRWNPVEVPV